MGFYVNPPSMEKEQFLEKYGERLNFAPNEDFDFSGDFLPVCWIHNGSFSAAGIVFSVGAFVSSIVAVRIGIWLYHRSDNPRDLIPGGENDDQS